MDIKSRWRDIVIVLLVVSNLFIGYNLYRAKRNIGYLYSYIYSVSSDLDTLKTAHQKLEGTVKDNEDYIEELFDIVQGIEKRRLFGY